MRKLLLFMLAAFAFAACEQAPIEELSVVRADAPETLTVSLEGDDTRIQLNKAQKTVWTKGDQVSVFYRSNANQLWKYTGATGSRTANLKRVDAGSATRSMDRVVVVYPYNEDYYINPSTFNVQASLPAVQHYLKDSYGLDGNIMISSAEYNDVTLKNVCGWLKLQLTGNGEVVRSIKFRGNNGEQVAGELYINSADATAILASDMGNITEDEGENATGGAGANLSFDGVVLKKVTLDCGEGVTLGAEATSFYIALPPQTFEKGFTVDVKCDGYKPMTLSTENALTIERNHIQPMGVIEVEGLSEAEDDWFELSVFFTNEYEAEGYYSYNSLFYTMKGTNVASVSAMIATAEIAASYTTDEILSKLQPLGADSIAQINSAEGLFSAVGGCPADTELVFFALAENADGDTVLVRKSATTTAVIVPDSMTAWIGTYEATIENYYMYDGSYEATYENYYKIDRNLSETYEPTTDKFEFVVGFDEQLGLYVDGFSVQGGGWPTLAGVDEEGNLAIYSGIYLDEDQGYRCFWLAMGDLYKVSGDTLVPIDGKQGKFYAEQLASHFLVKDEAGAYSCNAAEYNMGDGTVFKVVFSDIFALDGHLSPYFIIDAWPARYRAGSFAVTKISDEVKDLTAN